MQSERPNNFRKSDHYRENHYICGLRLANKTASGDDDGSSKYNTGPPLGTWSCRLPKELMLRSRRIHKLIQGWHGIGSLLRR